jgi:hypothetical protein
MGKITMNARRFIKTRFLFPVCAALLSASLGLFLVSCYPGDDISSSQSDIVVTVPKPSADFSTKLTYARTPDVCEITEQNQASCDITPNLNHSTEQQIMA